MQRTRLRLKSTIPIFFGLALAIQLGQQRSLAETSTGEGQDAGNVVGIGLHIFAKGTGAPLSRVEIRLPNGQKLFSGKDGVSQLPTRTLTGAIEIYRAGYEVLTLEPKDLPATGDLDIFLYPAPPSDNEVIITGQKRPEVSRKSITIKEAVKVAPGGDPAQIPKLLPGVQANTFSPDIVVRGSGPSDTRYLVESWHVPYIFHRIGQISVIPEQILSDVEFASGGFGVQYGEATGGVVGLRTKNEVPERPKTEFKINIPFYSGIYHERAISDGKDLFALSARRSYIEYFLTPILKRQGAGVTLIPYFGDEHAYYYHPTDDGHVKILGLNSYDGIHAVFPFEASDREDGRGTFDLLDQVYLLGVEWKSTLSRDWTLTVSPRLEKTNSKIDILDNRIHVGATEVGSEVEATRRLSGKDRLYVGADAGYLVAKADVLAPRPDPNDPFFDYEEAPKVSTRITKAYSNLAGWAAIDQSLGPATLTPGIRAFYSSRLRKTSADPRLQARYKLDDANTLKSAVGQYSETPEFQDTDPTFGNPDLNFIRSYHYILGIETTWGERWTTDFQGYYKETKGLVRSDPSKNKSNSGSMISSGFEAFIRRNLTERLFGWLAYTYSRTRERSGDQEAYHASQYDQTHVVNFAGNYKLTAVWDIGGRLLYHTGDTYTPVDDAVYNANLDKYQPRTFSSTKPYSGRLPAYHELDLYADKDWLYDTWTMTLRFGLTYLALERQAQNIQYNYDYSKKEYFRGVPPIPYLELRGTL